MTDTAARFMRLFDGFAGAHGTHGEPERDPNKLKWEIKKTARTLREPVTIELWQQHLDGVRPLGVITIREDGTCSHGSIDVDQYDIDLMEVIRNVEKMKLPLIPCRSKSGGLHLFIFTTEPVQAAMVQKALKDMSAALGLAGSEIFPKQTSVLVERGDLGSWMVMPYFGGDFGGKLRMQVGLKKTGAEMTVSEFLRLAEASRVTPEMLEQTRRSSPTSHTQGNGKLVPFKDGPPCLQHLAASGFPEGGRNNALFMCGVYCKRKHPGDWQAKLEEHNTLFMRPPLSAEEVTTSIRSLDKRDYQYTCKVEPMASHCDSAVCRTRRFGVGQEGNYPDITHLARLDVEPTLWFVDVGGDTRVAATTDQLTDNRAFNRLCAEKNLFFKPMKADAWAPVLNDAAQNLEILPTPPEVGREGTFIGYLEVYLTDKWKADRREDLLAGRPWEDTEKGRYYLRLDDLMDHMKSKKMDVDKRWVTHWIRKMGGEDEALPFVINGHPTTRNFWWLPVSGFQRAAALDTPPRDRTPI